MSEANAAQPHLYQAEQLATMTGSRRNGRRIARLRQALSRAER